MTDTTNQTTNQDNRHPMTRGGRIALSIGRGFLVIFATVGIIAAARTFHNKYVVQPSPLDQEVEFNLKHNPLMADESGSTGPLPAYMAERWVHFEFEGDQVRS